VDELAAEDRAAMAARKAKEAKTKSLISLRRGGEFGNILPVAAEDGDGNAAGVLHVLRAGA
jgi:hypothetical protein